MKKLSWPLPPNIAENRWIAFIVILAIGLRLTPMALGSGDNTYGGDTDAWNVLARVRHAGGSAYQPGVPYNYGPVWMWLLDFCRLIDARFFSHFHKANNMLGQPSEMYRAIYVVILSMVDIAIAWLLWLRINGRAALLYLFLPLGIIITGRHNQFDDISILFALMAAFLFERAQDEERATNRPFYLSAVFLGLSLATKHSFIFFPLWLGLKPQSWKRRVLIVTIPYALFFSSFLPYWAHYREGILNNVFRYNGLHGSDIFRQMFLPPFLDFAVSPMALFVAIIFIAGWLLRNVPAFVQCLAYGFILLCAAPCMANQYYILAFPLIAVFFNSFFAAFTVFITGFLLFDEGIVFRSYRLLNPENILLHNRFSAYKVVLPILLLGCAYAVWKQGRHIGTTKMPLTEITCRTAATFLAQAIAMTSLACAAYQQLAPITIFP